MTRHHCHELARRCAGRQSPPTSREAFVYVEGSAPLTRFRDLERVATMLAARADDGRTVPSRSEGTVVDGIEGGVAYAVEFSQPMDALATLLPNELRSLEETGM